jgi:hypothetical protein
MAGKKGRGKGSVFTDELVESPPSGNILLYIAAVKASGLQPLERDSGFLLTIYL